MEMEEVCDELRKRMADVRCLLKVKWSGQGARMWGWRKDFSCGGQKIEVELVVWELW